MTLQRHLFTQHSKEWASECERLQLKIRAKDALEAIAKFQGTTAESLTEQRPRFTQESFINALAEFIVASDQVYLYIFYSIFILLIMLTYSLSVLWRLRNLEAFSFY